MGTNEINVRSLTPNMTKYLAFGPLYPYLKAVSQKLQVYIVSGHYWSSFHIHRHNIHVHLHGRG